MKETSKNQFCISAYTVNAKIGTLRTLRLSIFAAKDAKIRNKDTDFSLNEVLCRLRRFGETNFDCHRSKICLERNRDRLTSFRKAQFGIFTVDDVGKA